ncbi:hypothetical protein ACHAQA_003324 [Verticillium albo-atrum]
MATVTTVNQPESLVYVEPLFLDLTVHEVATNTACIPVVEPWATMYVDAIRDGRYGDAVWARYHITGNVIDGVIPQLGGCKDKTVLESIEEDALEALENSWDLLEEAVELFRQTKDSDGHKEVIDLLARCSAMAAVSKVKL